MFWCRVHNQKVMDTARCVRETGCQTPRLSGGGVLSSGSSCHDSMFETASETGTASEAESESSANVPMG